ncbi:hypothetical protein BXZ70DRAFT_891049 [Cristinia sonorae]|uniref:Aminoglycoside phosphotransferase domain-containing protein n=1 Tax=Cristinia sonorae TaxID=1940300 RepID=A0A8K0XRD1_9AGAR|nr:hypothetical protein BXZ70DRAFT_891049 [Cristinia sonorae]
MPLYTCSVEECGNPGVRGASCKLCIRHLCDQHLSQAFHRCPDWEREEVAWKAENERARRQEVERLLSQLNVDALKARASALRGGVPCRIPILSYNKATISEIMGGTNYHIPIEFADGGRWLCRIRRNNITMPPSELQNHRIRNEFATLQFLASTRVPVPRVFDFGVHTPNNVVGVPYILMERLNGRPFTWAELRPFQRTKILQQFADVYIELSKHPFPSIGCLLPSISSSWKVGPIVFETHADTNPYGRLLLPGPFTTSTQYRRDIVQRHLELIRSHQTNPKRRLDSYLMHLFLLESFPAIANYESSTDGNFYLRHMDDKGDHILIDEDMNIVGIIDWEWAQTCPKAEAFSSTLCIISTPDYNEGNNALGVEELQFADILQSKGALELAGYVRSSRLAHRLTQCIGSDMDDKASFSRAFKGLRQALNGATESSQSWPSWKRYALKKYENDQYLQEIVKSQADADAASQDTYDPRGTATSLNLG